MLPRVARRICRQLRRSDAIWLQKKRCALLLPATPFSGAQAVASRMTLLLSGMDCELYVYHGTTAVTVMQRLHENGATPVLHEECEGMFHTTPPEAKVEQRTQELSASSATLPYLASLASYPPPHLLHLFPYELACRYQCVPVGAERKKLTLATCHWLNREIIAQVHTVTRRDIFQVRCEITMIDEVLRYWQCLQEASNLTVLELQIDEACNSSR